MKSSRIVFSENLRKLRSKTDWTQSSIARRIGIEQATYQRWESGTNMPDPANLDSLARIFGVNYADFFSTENSTASIPPKEMPSLTDSFKVICDELGFELPPQTKRKKIHKKGHGYDLAHVPDSILEQLTKVKSNWLLLSRVLKALVRASSENNVSVEVKINRG